MPSFDHLWQRFIASEGRAQYLELQAVAACGEVAREPLYALVRDAAAAERAPLLDAIAAALPASAPVLAGILDQAPHPLLRSCLERIASGESGELRWEGSRDGLLRDVFARLLADRRPSIRRAALGALAWLVPPSLRLLQEVVGCLHDSDATVRRATVERLTDLAHVATAAVAHACLEPLGGLLAENPTPAVPERRALLDLLQRLGAAARPLAPALVPWVRSPLLGARVYSVLLELEPEPALLAEARSQRASRATPVEKPRPASPPRDPLLVLEERGPESVSEVFERLGRGDADRERLVTCLRRMYGSPRVEDLEGLLETTQDPEARALIYDAVAQLGRYAAPIQERLWERLPTEPARRELVRCLCRVFEPAVLQGRLLGLRDDDPGLFAELVGALRGG